ncbi:MULTISPECIES: exodeoxyribonuclease V subunit gamma [Dyella]|nr:MULTISPECIES: exodeoxyribonuclease V subunit gamma [Dyella]
MVIHGNRLEDLRDLLTAWLSRAPLRPLESELMLVQSNGIAQWLKLALARPASQGGLGISAAVDVELPGRFLWLAYRAVLGHDAVPPTSPFDKARLTWRLLRLIPAHRDEPAFRPLCDFLGDDPDWRKRFQLASRIADLFDQYQVYRSHWLDAWERGEDALPDDWRGRSTPLTDDQRWQPALWRLLLEDVGPGERDTHRAAVHLRFMEAARQLRSRPAGLPRRVVVFGISSLPQQTLEALTALADHCQIFLVVANPCRHYWADIIEDRELLRADQKRHAGKPGLPAALNFEEMHLHANPLLAAWGKQGRDYIRLLDAFDRPERYRPQFAAWQRGIDLFEDTRRANLLEQVQQAVLDLEPLPRDPAQRQPWHADDPSIRFHIAHSPQREVEILHDHLLAMFERAAREGSPLSARDVIVMVPDIQTYAPHVQAVFGRIPRDDPRHLPYSLADQPDRGTVPLLVALEQLLSLPESRFTVSDILDLLDVPSLRQRFGFDEASLPTLRRWIEDCGIRWGLDGAQKATLGLPPEPQNSWRFGLRRMLLGYATGYGDIWEGIAPHGDVGGLDAALLGPLSQLIDALEASWRNLGEPATPHAWVERLRRLLRDFFDAEEQGDSDRLVRLDDALDTWLDACDEARLVQPLPLNIVREHWLSTVDEARLSQRFMGGAVSFGTLMPMRAIPFRVVCLLGMNDDDYPRRQMPADFDLMALPGHGCPGDRSRREDDRYLFLEAMLSARDALHVSWVGRSARDNAVLPPSVLVSQLRDYLGAGWFLAGQPDGDLLSAMTTEYPLQPFSARYFEASADPHIFTYAHEWQRAHVAPDVTAPSPLEPWQPEAALSLGHLQDFLARPVRFFFRQRLKVNFGGEQADTVNDEPFTLDRLSTYAAVREILDEAMGADEGDDTTARVAASAQRWIAEGRLPPGGFGPLWAEAIAREAQHLLRAWSAVTADCPRVNDKFELRYEAHGLVVEEWLADLRRNEAGELVRVELIQGEFAKAKSPRLEKLIPAWVTHLLAHACDVRMHTFIVAHDGLSQFAPLPAGHARALLDDLLRALRRGLDAPLPVARKTAIAWLLAESEGKDAEEAARKQFDRNEGDRYHRAEIDEDPYLARAWPQFEAMRSAGFDAWLPLYRPLVAAWRQGGEA